jgi:putative PIN family toxin of toxin-antitoxin system
VGTSQSPSLQSKIWIFGNHFYQKTKERPFDFFQEDKMTIRVVIDTNIVFEGVTKKGGASGIIIDSWSANLFTVCVSNALAYEYKDVLSRKLSVDRWEKVKLAIKELLVNHSEFVSIWFSWRPMSPDPGDDHVIDCAMNGRAIIVTSNVKDFKKAKRKLGVGLLTPVQFLEFLTTRYKGINR